MFEQRRTPHPLLLVTPQHFRFVSRQGRAQSLGQLVAGIQRFDEFVPQSVALRLRQHPGNQTGRNTRARPVQRAQVDLILQQCFVANSIAVGLRQLCSETGAPTRRHRRACERRRYATPNYVGPQRHRRTCDVSPQHIQTLMPVVEFIIFIGLEGRSTETKRLQVVAESRPDDVRRDMGSIGHTLRGHDIAAGDRLPIHGCHEPPRADGMGTSTTGTRRRRPRGSGRSIVSGE